MSSHLALFRRHQSTCTERYAKDFRIVEKDSRASTGKPQCNCSIYAEGTLRRDGEKKYIKQKNTGYRIWPEARRVTDQWDSWFDTKPPEPKQSDPEPEYKLVAVDEAVTQFYDNCRSNEISDDRIKQYEQLLTIRLLPFVASRPLIRFIRHIDNAPIWDDFRKSWKNENLNRNRRVPNAQRREKGGWVSTSTKARPLNRNTRARMVADLGVFMRFCLSREWLSDNWAAKITA